MSVETNNDNAKDAKPAMSADTLGDLKTMAART